jgi:site-specific DNA recombinase
MKGFVRSALYARVSSQKQAEEMTIESQIAAIRDRARRDHLEFSTEFEFCDAGYSGADLRRPAMEQLRDAVASGTIDCVYVHSPDRLARKLSHQAILLEEFSKYECEVVFLNQEGIPQTPEANLLIQMQGMIAEYEREKIMERTRRGRRYAAKLGRVSVLNIAPFGYRRIPKRPDGGDVSWEVNPLDAAIIKLIFELVAIRGYSLGQVRRELFARGIRTPKGNEHWDNGTLRGMLTNPAYQGTAKYGRERLVPRKPGRRPKQGSPAIPRQSKVTERTLPEEQETILVPAIVDPKVFQAVRERMDENRKRHRERSAGVAYLLSGLLVCGCCGCAYCGRRHSSSNAISYFCIATDKARRLGKTVCDNSSVAGPALEERVWTELCELLKNPERIREELERRRKESKGEPQKLHDLEKNVTNLRARLDRVIDAYTSGLIERDEFEARAANLRTQYRRESDALDSLRGTVHETQEESRITDSLSRLSHQVESGLDDADFNLKRELLKLLIHRIEIHKAEIRIVYKVPQRPFCQSPDNRGTAQHWLRFQLLAPWADENGRILSQACVIHEFYKRPAN